MPEDETTCRQVVLFRSQWRHQHCLSRTRDSLWEDKRTRGELTRCSCLQMRDAIIFVRMRVPIKLVIDILHF